ncbi:MAG: hypothetical protein ACREQV_21020, partial [Candidatus Binatia bacterium]
FIDIVNPLHHVPIVATIYRNVSGDQIGAASRVIGGALWGRIGGFVTGVANAVVEWWSGRDIGDHIYAAIFGPAKDQNATAVAHKQVAPSRAAPGALGALEAAKPRSSKNDTATAVETAPAAAPESDAVIPNALRSEIPLISRAARTSYEKHRNWGEPDESLGIRFPA